MREVQITIDGVQYTLTPLTACDYQAVLDEWKAAAPDPVDEVLATANKLPENLRDEFIKKHLDAAFEEKKRAGGLNDPKFKEYLETLDGAGRLFARTMRRHHGHLSPGQTLEVFGKGVAEHGEDIFRQVVPSLPEGAAHRGRGRKGVLQG